MGIWMEREEERWKKKIFGNEGVVSIYEYEA